MKCKAKVVVTLIVECDDTWSDECTLAQVKKQALDKANSRLSTFVSAFQRDGIKLVKPQSSNIEITITES